MITTMTAVPSHMMYFTHQRGGVAPRRTWLLADQASVRSQGHPQERRPRRWRRFGRRSRFGRIVVAPTAAAAGADTFDGRFSRGDRRFGRGDGRFSHVVLRFGRGDGRFRLVARRPGDRIGGGPGNDRGRSGQCRRGCIDRGRAWMIWTEGATEGRRSWRRGACGAVPAEVVGRPRQRVSIPAAPGGDDGDGGACGGGAGSCEVLTSFVGPLAPFPLGAHFASRGSSISGLGSVVGNVLGTIGGVATRLRRWMAQRRDR